MRPQWRRDKARYEARRRKRAVIRVAQNNLCAICGSPFGSIKATLEHVIPRSRGGKYPANLLVSHASCNQARGAAMPTGCLIIMLAAVNARCGWDAQP